MRKISTYLLAAFSFFLILSGPPAAATDSYINARIYAPNTVGYHAAIYVKHKNMPVGEICFKLDNSEVTPGLHSVSVSTLYVRLTPSSPACFAVSGDISNDEGRSAFEVHWPTTGLQGTLIGEISFWNSDHSTLWKRVRLNVQVGKFVEDKSQYRVDRSSPPSTIIWEKWFPPADDSSWLPSLRIDGTVVPVDELREDGVEPIWGAGSSGGIIHLELPRYKVGPHSYQWLFTRESDGKVLKLPLKKVNVLKVPSGLQVPEDETVTLDAKVRFRGTVTFLPGKVNYPWPGRSVKGVRVNYRVVPSYGSPSGWQTSYSDKTGKFYMNVIPRMNSNIEVKVSATPTSSATIARFKVKGTPWIRVSGEHRMTAGKTYRFNVSTNSSYTGTCMEIETWSTLSGIELGRSFHVIDVRRGHGSFYMKAKYFGQVSGIVGCGGNKHFELSTVSFSRLST